MVHLFDRACLISYFVLVFFLFATSSYAEKVVEVNVICNQAENPSFCSRVLNSKPDGVIGVDLINFAQYTVDVVRANLTNSINLINGLIAQSSTNPKARKHYKGCLVLFKSALDDAIEYTQQRLNLGDYNGVNVAASSVMDEVDACVSGEGSMDPPYHDTSLLPTYANVVRQVVQIVLIISNYLNLIDN